MAKYINADALISDVKEMRNTPNGYSDTFDKSEIIGVIEEQPAADVRENVRGEWKVEHGVMMHDDIYGDLYRCSECGYWERDVDGHNFCTNCGADIRKKGEE